MLQHSRDLLDILNINPVRGLHHFLLWPKEPSHQHSPDPQCLNSRSEWQRQQHFADGGSSPAMHNEVSAQSSRMTILCHRGFRNWDQCSKTMTSSRMMICVWKQGKLASRKKIPMNNASDTASCRDIYSPSLWIQDKQHWASSISTEQAFCIHTATVFAHASETTGRWRQKNN